MEYRICDVSNEQLDQILALEKKCFSVPWTREQLLTQMPDKMHILIAAESEGSVLGYVGMMYVLDEGYISNIAVSPEHRRYGIADLLISELLNRAEKLSLSFVTLEVRESNTPARALYAKHGFKDVGRRKNYYDFPTEDAILMTTFLK